jgi:hypothetical protein
MDDAQKNLIKQMISAELSGKAIESKGLLGERTTASTPVPPLASLEPLQASVNMPGLSYPAEVLLDEYETLMVNAIGWRLESVEKSLASLNMEKSSIDDMKHKLIDRCIKRLKIDINNFNLSIDANKKSVKIQRRG